MKPPKTLLRVKMPPASSMPSPQAANWFNAARVEGTYQLLIGYLDLGEIHEIVKAQNAGKEGSELDVTLLHRVSISPEGMRLLRRVLDKVAAPQDLAPPDESDGDDGEDAE